MGLKKKPGLAALKQLYDTYKRGARLRDIQFFLTMEEFEGLTSQRCFYCNQKPIMSVIGEKNIHQLNGDYIYNGVDRIDPKMGYSLYNCVPCCKRCNRAKYTMTIDEFTEWLSQILDHYFRRD